MSSIALPSGLARAATLYHSVIGKKVIMAVTGFVLAGFVLVHMIGNLQVFLPIGPDGVHPLDEYGRKLRAVPPLLWGARLGLLAAVVLHVVAAVQLTLLNRARARPVEYRKRVSIVASYAARTMVWSGPIIFFYLLYHLLHLTLGARLVHPHFREGHVYENLVTGLQNPVVALVYMIANVMLAVHLYHGAWSMFQSLGFWHPRFTPWLKRISAAYAWVIGIGFCIVPLAVLAGVVRLTRGTL